MIAYENLLNRFNKTDSTSYLDLVCFAALARACLRVAFICFSVREARSHLGIKDIAPMIKACPG